jgi:hypothetical protein
MCSRCAAGSRLLPRPSAWCCAALCRPCSPIPPRPRRRADPPRAADHGGAADALTARAKRSAVRQRQRECYELLETMGGACGCGAPDESARLLRGRPAGAWWSAAWQSSSMNGRPRPVRGHRSGAPVRHALTPAQSAALEPLLAAAAVTSDPAVPAPRRDRVGQDARVHRAAAGSRGAAGQGRDRAGARDRADAPDGRAVPRGVRRRRRRAALGAVRWRTLRRVARAARGSPRASRSARAPRSSHPSDLGAIIVDEEHEASYKQSEAPRYHAREVAVMRRVCRAVCVLGSATPALESWHNAQRGKYRLLRCRSGWKVGRCRPSGHRPAYANGSRRASTAAAPRPLILADRSSTPPKTGSPRRAEHPAAQPPRLRHVRAVSRVRERMALRRCNVSLTYHRGRKPTRLPLLPPRRAAARRTAPSAAPRTLVPRHRYRAGRARGQPTCSRVRVMARMDVDTTSAPSGRTTRSSNVSAAARSTSCSARR